MLCECKQIHNYTAKFVSKTTGEIKFFMISDEGEGYNYVDLKRQAEEVFEKAGYQLENCDLGGWYFYNLELDMQLCYKYITKGENV